MKLHQISESRAWAIAILAGLVAIVLEDRMQEPGFPARWIIIIGLVLGLFCPVRPWRWAVTVSAMLMAGIVVRLLLWDNHNLVMQQAVTWMAYIGKPNPFRPAIYQGIISIAPGLAANYFGKWVSEMLAELQNPSVSTT